MVPLVGGIRSPQQVIFSSVIFLATIEYYIEALLKIYYNNNMLLSASALELASTLSSYIWDLTSVRSEDASINMSCISFEQPSVSVSSLFLICSLFSSCSNDGCI